MTSAERRAAFEKWDSNIVTAYRGRGADGGTLLPCPITFHGAHARSLILVVADISVRSSNALGESLATLDPGRMRDAALEAAIDRYLAMAAPSGDRDNRLGERILAGLVHRGEPDYRSALVGLTAALPARTLESLDAEIERVLGGTHLDGLDDWPGDLIFDLRSSLVEATTTEWMHQRAQTFQIALGRDGAIGRRPRSARARLRGDRSG